jgi:hypothetical protein
MREDTSDATRALVRACAIVVIVSIALVSIVIVGWRSVEPSPRNSLQPPQVDASYTLFD